LVAVPDITVQITCLWGGEGYAESALAAFAEAIASGRPAMRNLYFDISEVRLDVEPEVPAAIAQRIREVGLGRVLFGSDDKVSPERAWWLFQRMVPLAREDFQQIASNVASHGAR